MPSSFMSWDACRNIRHHGTSRESECADCSIRKTKILKSSSFQNFTPSPDKIRIRKHSFLLPLSGACYNCRVRVGQNGTRFGNGARSKIISLRTYHEWPDGERAIHLCAPAPARSRPLETRREAWLDTAA